MGCDLRVKSVAFGQQRANFVGNVVFVGKVEFWCEAESGMSDDLF